MIFDERAVDYIVTHACTYLINKLVVSVSFRFSISFSFARFVFAIRQTREIRNIIMLVKHDIGVKKRICAHRATRYAEKKKIERCSHFLLCIENSSLVKVVEK